MKMHLLWLLIMGTTLSACSGEKPAPKLTSAPAVLGAPPMGAFDHTGGFSQDEILQLTGAALRSGAFLDQRRAEKCYREELNRPLVREACLLLWSQGGEDSEFLEAALAAGLQSSRMLAIGAVIRKTSVQKASAGALFSALELLKDDPVWLRAKAVELWGETNFAGRDIPERLEPYLSLEESPNPRELSSVLRAYFRINYGKWRELLAAYCNISVTGEARIRCWRLIGALASHDLPAAIAGELKPYLPSAQTDPDWTLFLRSFPELSKRTQKIFRQEHL